MMYRIGICDDDIKFAGELENYLLTYTKENKISVDVIVFMSGEEYLKFLQEEMPLDLLFLDIDFGTDMDGVEIGKRIRVDMKNEMTQIVYVSGSESYALQLFQNRPMDFLIKPVGKADVGKILDKYFRIFGGQPAAFFEYHVSRNVYRVMKNEILYFQCVGRKIQIVTNRGDKLEFYGNMQDVERQLEAEKFWRIHKSYIVNTDYVIGFQVSEILMADQVELPISRTFRNEIQEKLLRKSVWRRK